MRVQESALDRKVRDLPGLTLDGLLYRSSLPDRGEEVFGHLASQPDGFEQLAGLIGATSKDNVRLRGTVTTAGVRNSWEDPQAGVRFSILEVMSALFTILAQGDPTFVDGTRGVT